MSSIRTSGIRDKLRSNVLKELAKERATKKRKLNQNLKDDGKHQEAEDDNELDERDEERRKEKATYTNSLLSILPEPKNSSAFGPTVKLDKLLKMPERASVTSDTRPESPVERLADDGMVEVDVSKVVGDVTPSLIKDLSCEKSQPNAVIVPKGREKQKNQITYLAQLGKATELERKDQAAQSRMNKAAARSKYGW